MEWVNRVGIVLEFLSFWFAAPEILGEERLRALERRVEQGIKALPSALLLMAVVGVSGAALMYVGERVNMLPVPSEGRSALETMGFITGLWLGTVTVVVLPSPPSVSVGSKAQAVLHWLWMLWGSYQVVRLAQLAWRAKAWVWLGGALLAVLALALEVVLLIKQPSRALAWATMAAVVTGAMVALMWAGTRMGWVNRLLALSMVTAPWFTVHERIFPPLLRVLADDKRIRQRSLAVGAVLFVVGFLLQLIATF